MESFRKAYGALKDSTTVGLANLNSEFKDLDIAIVKATNHDECPPKERHIRKIMEGVSVKVPRADVAYCIHALSRRLSKTRNWIVAMKTLIVVHRILREGDLTFREEVLQYTRRGKLFQISNFKDDSSPLAWDCSAWIRSYALFLEEKLECFRTLQYDVETEKLSKSSTGQSKVHSRTRHLNAEELLHQLPALQQLLYRLLCCQPEGAACYNYLVQYALALVLKESFKIYCSINDGIINLVDMYFEMPKHDAVRALNIYKKAGKQAEHLAEFYSFCRTLELARTFQFPILRQPPPTFLATMEEYVKEAPQTAALSHNRLEYYDNNGDCNGDDDEPEPESELQESKKEEVERKEEMVEAQEEEKLETKEEEEAPPAAADEPADLLGLSHEVNPQALEIEERNALAFAILQPGMAATPSNALVEIGKTSGWELALVTTPSSTSKPDRAAEPNLGGGFDKLLLDSLYEDDAARRNLQLQSRGYSSSYGQDPAAAQTNPFDQQAALGDPFAVSNNYAPPLSVQMAMMSQQERLMMYQQQQQQQQQQMMMMSPHNAYAAAASQYPPPSNPFGDPFVFPQNAPPPSRGNNALI
ncbi:putative clathrin assembly protein At5g57200 [Andrographis paniculata]|uniref:putative clathrin assembly protein At5g57200 n=1 Tax=Andrographis paniculata TaxID=175694 RepID=UPI0021E7F0CF|nr:putative clathrin assembly protein At5g57200 [Andrographis paniculata]